VECLECRRQFLFSFSIRAEFSRIQVSGYQFAQFGLGKNIYGNIQHTENAFVAFPTNRGP
jgi:hypothetical protein